VTNKNGWTEKDLNTFAEIEKENAAFFTAMDSKMKKEGKLTQYESVVKHLQESPLNAVQITTYTNSWIFDQKDMKKLTHDGEGLLAIKKGKRSDSSKYASVRLAHYTES